MDKNKANVPKIRFPGFTDPWEKRKLGDILKYEQPTKYIVESTDYDDDFETPVLTAGQSFILGYTGEKQGIKSADKNNPVIIFDDFTTSSHYVDFPFKIKSSAIKLLTLKQENDDSYFAYNVLKNINYVSQSHERHWISKFSEFNVLMASEHEQKKVSKFFCYIDNLITLHQRKLNHLKDKKKGLLQKMFPKNGENFPELRFPGFTDPWEQRKLGELITPVAREVPKPTEPYEKISVRSHAKGTFHQKIENPDAVAMDKLFVVKENDLIVSITFAWEHAIAVATKEDDGLLVSHRFPTYTMSNSDVGFIKYVVSQENFRRKMELISPGGAGRNRVLDKKDFLNIEVMVPIEIEEQKKIGELLIQFDNLIALHQRKLKHLQEQKKALLQQMFV